jgi:uncharacterized protein with von Willebrand factor type A (vWA) domain
MELDTVVLDPVVLQDSLGVPPKVQDDIARMQGGEAARLLDEVRRRSSAGDRATMLPARQTPGRLAGNVVHFGRVLRHAGMPVGTDRIAPALQPLQVAGLESRTDLHATLSACLLDRVEHRELFDQAFHLFWRDPDLEGRMRAMLLPKVQLRPGAVPAPNTKLSTRATRLLKSRDPDIAVGQVVRAVQDWSGGTRITQSLHEFNRRWARRVLPGNGTVLLISDGLEHGETTQLAFEMERLHKS